MARILIVDDAFTGLNSLALAGAGGRNLPASAVLPGGTGMTWADVLAVDAASGDSSPQINWGYTIGFSGDAANAELGGFIGIDTVAGEYVVGALVDTLTGGFMLRLLGSSDPVGGGGQVRITPGQGPLGNGAVYIESVAYGLTVKVDDDGLGFFDGTNAYKPSVTGAKAGNAALASLLSVLDSMGLITDNTT